LCEGGKRKKNHEGRCHHETERKIYIFRLPTEAGEKVVRDDRGRERV
jgi:hypothetical protein